MGPARLRAAGAKRDLLLSVNPQSLFDLLQSTLKVAFVEHRLTQMLVNKRLVLASFSLGLFFEIGHKISIQPYMNVDLDVRESDLSFLKDSRSRDLPEARINSLHLSLLAHIPSFHGGAPALR